MIISMRSYIIHIYLILNQILSFKFICMKEEYEDENLILGQYLETLQRSDNMIDQVISVITEEIV